MNKQKPRDTPEIVVPKGYDLTDLIDTDDSGYGISNERISFNLFCMKKFEDIGYIQLLLHSAERKIAIRPCGEHDTHSIRWRPDPEKRIYSKTINCQHFGTALFGIPNLITLQKYVFCHTTITQAHG